MLSVCKPSWLGENYGNTLLASEPAHESSYVPRIGCIESRGSLGSVGVAQGGRSVFRGEARVTAIGATIRQRLQT